MILALRAADGTVTAEASGVDREWLARQTGDAAAEWRALLRAEELTNPAAAQLVRLAAFRVIR